MGQRISSVSIDFVICNEDRIWDYDTGGSLKISLNGDRLNKYVNEEDGVPEKGQKEHTGSHLFGDLYDILETTADIISNPEIYEVRSLQFDGYNDYMILEYLGEDTLRVAYRVRPAEGSDGSSFSFQADPASACGYPVKIEAWTEAVRSAVEQFQNELRANGDHEHADWFDSELTRLMENQD